jgi:hypothetical protein
VRVVVPDLKDIPTPFAMLPIDQSPCDGCTSCRHRCTAGIPLTHSEYAAIRDYLAAMDPAERQAVLYRAQWVERLDLDEQVDALRCQPIDPDDGRVADRSENAVVLCHRLPRV